MFLPPPWIQIHLLCLCVFVWCHTTTSFLLLIRSLLQSVPWFWKWFVSFYRCLLPCLEFRTLLTQLVEYHVDSVVGARGNGCGWPSCHCPGCSVFRHRVFQTSSCGSFLDTVSARAADFDQTVKGERNAPPPLNRVEWPEMPPQEYTCTHIRTRAHGNAELKLLSRNGAYRGQSTAH